MFNVRAHLLVNNKGGHAQYKRLGNLVIDDLINMSTFMCRFLSPSVRGARRVASPQLARINRGLYDDIYTKLIIKYMLIKLCFRRRK